jgi:hypothetical protein
VSIVPSSSANLSFFSGWSMRICESSMTRWKDKHHWKARSAADPRKGRGELSQEEKIVYLLQTLAANDGLNDIVHLLLDPVHELDRRVRGIRSGRRFRFGST